MLDTQFHDCGVECGGAALSGCVGCDPGWRVGVVGGLEVVDTHRVVDGFGHIGRADGEGVGVFGTFIGAAVDASSLNATSGHEHAHAGGPA